MIITKEYGSAPSDTTITTGDPVFIDVRKAPFRLYGLQSDFHRIPDEVGASVSKSVADLAKTPTGAVLRFSTDSDYIVMHADIYNPDLYSGIPPVSLMGFDVWFRVNGKYRYVGNIYPSQGPDKDYIEGRIRVQPGMHDVLVYFPLLSKIGNVKIALRCGAALDCGSGFMNPIKRIVFYGSSIVHGMGASRPSLAYPSIISRALDCEILNLGFSGAARAEENIIRYISGLDMSVFVYDYDHNAPNAEYLAATHYNGYRLFREAQPETPVIMASKVDYPTDPEKNEISRQVILESYRRGLAEGDKHLYFVDGAKIYDERFCDDLTYDTCHPNDAGYIAMANAFGAAIEKALKER